MTMRFAMLSAAALLLAGCGDGSGEPANQAAPIKIRGAEQEALHKLDAFNLAIALKHAIYDAGFTCKRVTDGGFVGVYENLDMWTATCTSDKGAAREAAEFYAATFPDSRVGAAMASPNDNPSMKAGGELLVEFTVLGRAFVGLNGGPNFTPNEAVSFMVVTEDQAETDRYWDAIVGNGGRESACGWCKDRWGFSWQITPRVLLEATTDPDRAAARRAMEAMMTMRKIDIATIEAARRGEVR